MRRLGPAVIVGTAVLSVIGAALAVQARADGFNHPFTSPVVVGALAVAALSGASIGLVLRKHAPVPGRLVVAAAGAIAVYLVLMTGAGLATADRHVGTLEPTVVWLAMLGHVPVLTLFPLTAIAMARGPYTLLPALLTEHGSILAMPYVPKTAPERAPRSQARPQSSQKSTTGVQQMNSRRDIEEIYTARDDRR